MSIIPNRHGEGVVLRIQQGQGSHKDLHELGMDADLLARFERLLDHQSGLILVTGPTGSGKTTTLYGALSRLNSPERKIITIEDPVEYDVPRVTQVEVNTDIDFTFSRGLRSILRHDPDVVMVGEIRDGESAEISIRASLTGHLVLSTLHTNDAPSAIIRLLDMGVPPYLVFSSLLGVVSQRLARVLCSECKEPAQIDAALLASLGVPADMAAGVFRARGCNRCHKLGYRGRQALFELMEVSEVMRRVSAEHGPDRFRQLALESGYVPLRQTALEAWSRGVTSLKEIVPYLRAQPAAV